MIALVALLVACGGDEPSNDKMLVESTSTGDTGTTSTPLPDNCNTVSWTATADPFVSTWCTSCHSSLLDGELRYGAPDGVDFETYAGASAFAERIRATALADVSTMPPAGGVSELEKLELLLWLDCGLPGEPDAPAADCSGPVTEVATLPTGCVEPISVSGDVVLDADTDLSCVCSISGDLTVNDGDQRLAALESVGGALFVTGGGEVDLPALVSVGGNVEVVAPTLTRLEIARLESVAGDVVVSGADALVAVTFTELQTAASVQVHDNLAIATVALPRLEVLTGDFLVADNPVLTSVLGDVYALTSVGGSLVLRDNPLWGGFYGFAYLEQVGGDVQIEGVAWDTVQGFTALDSVGGDLLIRDNPQLRLLDGFNQLVTVGGDLEISDNLALEVEEAFNFIDVVGGTVRLVGNPVLTRLDGLVLPSEVGGIEIRDNAALPGVGGFNGVGLITGNVVLSDMPGATALDGFHSVTAIGGDLIISGMPNAGSAEVFDDVTSIGGSLVLEDLPGISAPQIVPRLVAVGADYVARRVGWSSIRTGPNFQGINGSLIVEESPTLVAIEALGNLSTLGGLRVVDNPNLVSMNGLDAVTSVAGSVELVRNGLPSMSGLGSVDFIGENLIVDGNTALTSVVALHGVQAVGGDLVVTGNTLLLAANAQALATAIADVGGITNVSGNGP